MNQSLIEWVPKLLGASVGFIYLVGFLVVTRHLSSYGVSSFAVFQLQYLVAGVWVVAPIAVMALMQRAAQRFADRALSVQREGDTIPWRRRFIVACVTSVPGALLIGATVGFVGNIEGANWHVGAFLFIFYIAMLSSGDLLWLSWTSPQQGKQTWWANRHATPFYATLLMSIFLTYVSFFAVRIYPLVPYSLGGGKPLTVVFLMGDRNVSDFLATGKSSHTSAPYKLLATTEKTFVILPTDSNQESIEFNRDAVLGVVVLRESVGP
jgi:hypothetical protein